MKWTEKRHYDVLETGICRNLHRVRVAFILDQVEAAKSRRSKSLRILDVGCGDGVITRRLRERFPEEKIEALDTDQVRLDRARAYSQGVTFRQGDVTSLPYHDCAFEVVLCHHVLEHVVDDSRVLKECYRVLAPNGILVLGIPHEGGIIGMILRKLHPRLYAEGEHINFYTIAGMRMRLFDQGFVTVEYAKFGFLFPHYYIHLLLLRNHLTFKLGHMISQNIDCTADSLIFLARKAA